MSNTARRSILQRVKTGIKHWLKRKFPTIFFTPHMRRDECNLLKKQILTAEHIVEFGAGGSTFLFLKNKKQVYTVENNAAFVETLKGIKYFNNAIAGGRLNFCNIDLGPVRGWGRPADETKKDSWIGYAGKVWDNIPGDTKIDIVFVDGRFRVLCALYAIIKTSPDTRIIIHDFSNRTAYESLLEFLEPVASASTLVVFKKKHDLPAQRINELIQVYRYDPR
jgi:hypothetical protein